MTLRTGHIKYSQPATTNLAPSYEKGRQQGWEFALWFFVTGFLRAKERFALFALCAFALLQRARRAMKSDTLLGIKRGKERFAPIALFKRVTRATRAKERIHNPGRQSHIWWIRAGRMYRASNSTLLSSSLAE